MLYDYPYKYRIKFNPFSGRKRHCVIDNPSYTTRYLKELIQILMRIKLVPVINTLYVIKSFYRPVFSFERSLFPNVTSRKKKSHKVIYI